MTFLPIVMNKEYHTDTAAYIQDLQKVDSIPLAEQSYKLHTFQLWV